MRAAERYSLSITGTTHSQVLWDHPFLVAMHVVVSSATQLHNPFDREASHQLPVVYLLLCNVPEIPDPTLTAKTPLRAVLAEFLWDILSHKAQHITSQSGFRVSDDVLDSPAPFQCISQSVYLLWLEDMQRNKYEQRLTDIMTRGLLWPYFTPPTHAMHKALLRSIIHYDPGEHELDALSILHGLAGVVKEYNMIFNKPKRGSHTAIELSKAIVAERLRFILKEVNAMLARQAPRGILQNLRSTALQFIQISIDLALMLQAFDACVDDSLGKDK